MKKNFVLNFASALCCTGALAAMMTVHAAAYIDPSSVSILVSAISGVVIACGAAAYIVIRKVKRKAAEVLHIDENANKEVEADIEIKDDDEV